MQKMSERVYSVSEITQRVKFLIEDAYPRVLVEGEISNFRRHSSGHLYFSVKDETCQLAVVMFRSSAARLRFKPENGLKVVVRGALTVYERSGNYQINATGLRPCGQGELQLAFEQLKAKLAEEGLFDDERKKPLPHFPATVGLVTSPTGAAVQDMLNVLDRRFPGLRIVISPVRVQGKSAAGEIAAAIRKFNAKTCAAACDLLIVGRGGGSMEDLWPFNEEKVARAIVASEIPVISAVGHETDWSISDFVADMRAPTPSAAAELAVPDKAGLLDFLHALHTGIQDSIAALLADRRSRLAACTTHYVMREPVNLLRQFQQRVDEVRERLMLKMPALTHARRAALENLCHRLAALNPLAVLGRGYSLTRDKASGRVIKDPAQAAPGALIETLLCGGRLLSRVEQSGAPDDTPKKER